MNSDFIVAVHALVYLNHKADIVSSEALAENICTNAARVRKVMAPLKRAAFVTTREGNVGGYRFAGDAPTLDLRMVADALGIRFVQSSWHSGDMDMECLVASGMAGIMGDIFPHPERKHAAANASRRSRSPTSTIVSSAPAGWCRATASPRPSARKARRLPWVSPSKRAFPRSPCSSKAC